MRKFLTFLCLFIPLLVYGVENDKPYFNPANSGNITPKSGATVDGYDLSAQFDLIKGSFNLTHNNDVTAGTRYEAHLDSFGVVDTFINTANTQYETFRDSFGVVDNNFLPLAGSNYTQKISSSVTWLDGTVSTSANSGNHSGGGSTITKATVTYIINGGGDVGVSTNAFNPLFVQFSPGTTFYLTGVIFQNTTISTSSAIYDIAYTTAANEGYPLTWSYISGAYIEISSNTRRSGNGNWTSVIKQINVSDTIAVHIRKVDVGALAGSWLVKLRGWQYVEQE